jgi:hypothetical protein
MEDERRRRHTTTAVGDTDTDISIVGTNEIYLRTEIKRGLLPHEIVAKSKPGNHAEENILDTAAEKNLKIVNIGASRAICLDCEEKIKALEIETNTEFSGKKSKNRIGKP